eukprot:2393336-Pyramimonas_sp.AAC.1
MGRAINSATYHPLERTNRGYPPRGDVQLRTGVRNQNFVEPWDVVRVGRKDTENCSRVEGSAGMWSGLGW